MTDAAPLIPGSTQLIIEDIYTMMQATKFANYFVPARGEGEKLYNY
jgi:hypothetical protein